MTATSPTAAPRRTSLDDFIRATTAPFVPSAFERFMASLKVVAA